MRQITYDEGGLHLITGTCTAIEVDAVERERMNYGETEKYGYYTIMNDGNEVVYCITLNLPLCANYSPPNQYPAVNDRVIIYAEDIKRANHPQHQFIGYSESCRVVSDETDIETARKDFDESAVPAKTTVSILPKTMTLETILHLYDCLNDIGRRHFVKECIHPDDQPIVHKYIGVGFFVPVNSERSRYKFVEWNFDTANRAVNRDYYIIAHNDYGLAHHAEVDAETLKSLLGN